MSRSSRMAVVSGSCLLVMGACASVALAGETADVKLDALRDSLGVSSPRGELLLEASDADGARIDGSIVVAEVVAAAPAAGVAVHANNAGVSVGVTQEFTTFSDLTAAFRPSRWKNPFREGGALSWMNHTAWADAPGRTGEILLGEVIVGGAAYAIVNASVGDDDNNSNEEAAASESVSSSGTGSRGPAAPVSESSTSPSGGGSPVVPVPVEPSGYDESPF